MIQKKLKITQINMSIWNKILNTTKVTIILEKLLELSLDLQMHL